MSQGFGLGLVHAQRVEGFGFGEAPSVAVHRLRHRSWYVDSHNSAERHTYLPYKMAVSVDSRELND